MPLMRSPDGSETVEVPQDQVEHYRQMGAMLVRPAGSRGATAAAQPPPQPDMAQAVMPQEFEPTYSGAPDEPLEAPPWWADPLEIPALLMAGPAGRIAGAAERGTMAGIGAMRGAAERAPSALAKVAGKFVARRIPGLSTAMDLAEAATEAGGRKVAKEAAAEVTERSAGKVAAKIKPKAKPKAAAKPKPKAEAKPKTAPKPAPKKAEPGGVTTKPQRGQSGPALEQRAKMRAKYKSQRQSEGLSPAAQSDDLESLLQRSIELEQELGAMGISPMQRALARRTLGQAGGSAAGLAALAQILGVHDDQGGY